MDRNDIITAAVNIVNGGREESYGKPEDSFERIARFWSVYLDRDITPMQVGNMMMLLKIAREMHQHKDDNMIDIVGYAALTGELNSTYIPSKHPSEPADFDDRFNTLFGCEGVNCRCFEV